MIISDFLLEKFGDKEGGRTVIFSILRIKVNKNSERWMDRRRRKFHTIFVCTSK